MRFRNPGQPISSGTPDKIKLQLKWLHQAQFAGLYVAADKGYYKDQNLDVEILPGGPDVVPSQKVTTGAADVGIDWVGSLLANRDKGQPIVDIMQTYQASGLRLISKKTTGSNTPADLKGKKDGDWNGRNRDEGRAEGESERTATTTGGRSQGSDMGVTTTRKCRWETWAGPRVTRTRM